MASNEISNLNSGASYSTLAAALMCDRFDRVHLLTYYNSMMPFADKAKINATKLAKRYGENKIVHEIIDFEPLFKKLYYGTYFNDLMSYKSYLTPCLCIACQLTMHTSTILYNIKNKIKFTCDGYKHEKNIYHFNQLRG
jgi:hypothetical protein